MDREWARPDSEGDPWHEYWEPEGSIEQRVQFGYEGPQAEAPAVREARRRIGRRMWYGYLIGAPIVIVLDLLLWLVWDVGPGGVFLGALLTLLGLIRIMAYGERSKAVVITMVAFFLAFVAMLVARAL